MDNAKIVGLSVDNIKRVKAVQLSPDSAAVVEITGENAQGKSSILDAIWAAIGGKKAEPDDPIHDGANEAQVTLKIRGGAETISVKKRFWRTESGETTSSLVVTAGMGKLAAGQTVLNALIGELAFEPVAFMEMRPEEQFETLKRFVPNFDFEANQAEYDRKFARRTDVNRDAKSARARADGIQVPDAQAGAVDEAALVKELEDAGVKNAALAREQHERKSREEALDRLSTLERDLKAERASVEKRLAQIDKDLGKCSASIESLAKEIAEAPELPAPVDTAALRSRIEAARSHNMVVRARTVALETKSKFQAEAAQHEALSATLTAELDALEKARTEAITRAELPIAGLGFGKDHVTYKGHPLGSASQAERIQVAVAIAAALNPRLRIMFVREASLLDKKSWAALCRMAREMDVQVFAETVSSDRPGAVVIEDGMVKGVNG